MDKVSGLDTKKEIAAAKPPAQLKA
jgi:hypothetical protein